MYRASGPTGLWIEKKVRKALVTIYYGFSYELQDTGQRSAG